MKTTGGLPVAGRPSDVLRQLAAALPRQWGRYRRRLKQCRTKFFPAAVHDSRVETRRLLATLELLGAFIPGRELEKLRRALKEYLDMFDHLRDTQVQLGSVEPMQRAFPAAQQFRAWLRQREVRFIRDARRAVKRIKVRRVGKRIEAIASELRRQRKSNAPEPTFSIAQDAIRLAFARVGRLCRRVKAADPRTIHRTRIAFKRFRYMVDALSSLLPAVTEKHLQAMRSYQRMMGEIQDSKVLLAALDKFEEQVDNDPATQRLRAEFVRRHKQSVRVYVNAAPRLWLFWPPKRMSPRHTKDKNKQP